MDQGLDFEVGDRRTRHVGHAHSQDEGVDQVAHDHVLVMDRLVLGEPGVRVQRVVVHRDHAKEVVVGLGDRLAGPVLVHVADLELLEVATEGTLE